MIYFALNKLDYDSQLIVWKLFYIIFCIYLIYLQLKKVYEIE